MSNHLRQLPRPALLSLAEAFAAGWLDPAIRRQQLLAHVPEELADVLLSELEELRSGGMLSHHLALFLRLLAEERQAAQAMADRVELVWSGPDLTTSATRDTEVVIAQLFREAKRSVLVSSFAIDKGKKARALFGELALRMDEEPGLSVRFCLNVQRKGQHDDRPEAEVLREFAESFRREIWPGSRLPEVFHDPRSLIKGGHERASLHAKCVVIDEEKAFVTSANFTEAAQVRNIEAGLLVVDLRISANLRSQFENLIDRGTLRRIPGL